MSINANRPAARAVVLHGGYLLVMRRDKAGRRYMVTPGGRLEPGEKPEVALLRELAEETMVKVANPKLVFIEEPNDPKWGSQYIYLCDYISGYPKLHPDSEEMQSNKEGKNLYYPMWINLNEFPDPEFPFLSQRLGEEIVAAAKAGFPSQPKRWILNLPVLE